MNQNTEVQSHRLKTVVLTNEIDKKLTTGEIYNYRFSTKELKQPIQTAVTESGWTYKGVAFGKL